MIVRPDAGTGRYTSVGKDTAHIDTGVADKEMIPDVSFIIAQETFTSEVGLDPSLLPGGFDKIHQAADLFAGKQQFRIMCSTPHGKDREQPPLLEPQADEILLDLREVRIVPPVHTGDDIKGNGLGIKHHLDGGRSPLERTGNTPHPVVVRLQAVQADGHRTQAAPQKPLIAIRSKRETVGNHAPGKALFVHHPSALFQVRPHQRFPAGDVDHDLVRIRRRSHIVQDAGEILQGHVGLKRRLLAVAAAMPAMMVAAQGTFPEQLAEMVSLDHILPKPPEDIQCQTPSQRKPFRHD